jgi:hypothetical protein
MVLTLADGRIASMTRFLDMDMLVRHGLLAAVGG